MSVERGGDVAHANALAALLGEVAMKAFADPAITELAVNPDGKLWVDVAGVGWEYRGFRYGDSEVELFVNAVAAGLGRTLTAEAPSLAAELPRSVFRGARLQAFVSPIVQHPVFNLRKPPSVVYPLTDYVERRILSSGAYDALAYAVQERWNIVVAGPTASGKTTFANALISEMVLRTPGDRFVILEDTAELQCAAPNSLALRAQRGALEPLVKDTLRVSPQRIVVGEVRDASAYYMLDAWSTGHPGGCCTVHAASPEGALERLDRLARLATPNGAAQRELVGEAVDVVVVIQKTAEGRRVTDVARVLGYRGDAFELQRLDDRDGGFQESASSTR